MKKIQCQYAIIRFAPYIETGEFANVGIILIAPKQGYFNFKLAIQRYGRITQFFEELEAKVYKETLRSLREELLRATNVLKDPDFEESLKANNTQFVQTFFNEVIRPRETIVRFSEIRTVLAERPEDTLKELFGFYVERNFVTKEYKETVLERGVRRWLCQENLDKRFTRKTVGDDFYHAKFPFVESKDDRPVKIIKPLNLTHDEPSKIIDHGGAWLFRIEQLKKRNQLPKKVLFTVAGPDRKGKRKDACREIENDLIEVGVNVIPYKDKTEIINFALSE